MLRIRNLLIAFILGVTSLLASPSNAQGVPSIVPPCTIYTISNVGEVCGYKDVEDWKLVLKADTELYHLRQLLPLLKSHTEKAELQTINLKIALDSEEKINLILKDQNRSMNDQLIEKDRLYQNERVKPRSGSFIPWTISAVLGSVLVGYIAADIAN